MPKIWIEIIMRKNYCPNDLGAQLLVFKLSSLIDPYLKTNNNLIGWKEARSDCSGLLKKPNEDPSFNIII